MPDRGAWGSRRPALALLRNGKMGIRIFENWDSHIPFNHPILLLTCYLFIGICWERKIEILPFVSCLLVSCHLLSSLLSWVLSLLSWVFCLESWVFCLRSLVFSTLCSWSKNKGPNSLCILNSGCWTPLGRNMKKNNYITTQVLLSDLVPVVIFTM